MAGKWQDPMQEGGTALRNMGVKVLGSRRRQDSVGRDLAQCDGFNNNPISQAGGSRLGAGGRKMLTLGAASPGLPLALDRCCLVSGPVSSPAPPQALAAPGSCPPPAPYLRRETVALSFLIL